MEYFARKAMWAPIVELLNLIPGCNDRPADVYIPVWSNGRQACIDVSVVSPVKQSMLPVPFPNRRRMAHQEQCVVANDRESEKKDFGGCGDPAQNVVDRLVRDAGVVPGSPGCSSYKR